MKNCGDYVHFQIAERAVLQEMIKIVKKKVKFCNCYCNEFNLRCMIVTFIGLSLCLSLLLNSLVSSIIKRCFELVS